MSLPLVARYLDRHIPSSWIQSNGNLRPRIRIAILAAAYLSLGTYLYFHGQPLICECGYVKLWENEIQSGGNSQHVADWYTLSHFLHGVLIVMLWRFLFPRLPMRYAFLAGVVTAVSWEVIEHTEFVLNRFREATISFGYRGDSVLNSMMDSIFMSIGLYTATLLRLRNIIILFLTVELISASFARDSLILSTLMLLYPIESVKTWQMGR